MTGDVRITVTRTLSRDQQARRARLVQAAHALASEGGYPAVTMHDVADRAGVARATVYRYFSSKDHLLTEVAADWARVMDDLADVPGADPVERLRGMLEALVAIAADNLPLTSAIVQAATSGDAGVDDARNELFRYIRERFGAAIDPDRTIDAVAGVPVDDVEVVIGHVVLAALIGLTTLARPREEVSAMVGTAARLIMGGR
ncbi:TetR family transcriptional regulator [Actinocorallia sp. API 0066]|uniref:TetR/AcrR family transcriptional regulator n=1 Tax=Actinocorallia sp. API 0066 TaxID=2896846 RepID=UPI001E52005F|nr:TetR/AcrR family transcriptional regulator [Actinocorallia sp. API 0066]MCD0451290.1 TetR family transcriptional regulator [Actinocorallia sp. API 0066]